MIFYVFLGSGYRFLDRQSVQGKIAIRSNAGSRRIAYDTFLGIETFLAYVATFHQGADFQSEMLRESVVAAIGRRNRHDRSRTVAGQYIVADPDGNRLARKRVNSVGTTEYTGYLTVGDALALGTFLGTI